MQLPAWMERLAAQCTPEELARLEQCLATPLGASSPPSGGLRRDNALGELIHPITSLEINRGFISTDEQ
jgi:hypothetical protein